MWFAIGLDRNMLINFGLLKIGSGRDCKAVSLSFLVTFATNFNAIF